MKKKTGEPADPIEKAGWKRDKKTGLSKLSVLIWLAILKVSSNA
ncbi:MAG: hypothetical protein WC241_04320 [Candidatus Paceibacterota bacterium]|jgi:hypothetical protein